MLRLFQLIIISGLMTSSLFAQRFNDDADHSGDYEASIYLAPKVPLQPKPSITNTKSKQATPHRPSEGRKSDLQGDINDFLELIPIDDVKEKIEEYYRNDMDVQHIYEYLTSKEFFELRKHLLDLQDVKEVLQYLNRKGFNVKMLIRKIGHRLGITKMRPPKQVHGLDTSNQDIGYNTNTTIGGLNGLLENILEVLPQDEIFVLFFEKLEKSNAFNVFVDSIGNPEFVRKYMVLWNSKELHSASAQLKKHKIDVSKIIQILQNYFFFGSL